MRGLSASLLLTSRLLVMSGAVGLTALLVGVALGTDSTMTVFAVLGALGIGAFVAFGRQVRRPLIATLFFVAPFDISKAVIAPLGSIFYESGPYFSPGLYLTLGNVVLLALSATWLFKCVVIERRAPPVTRLDVVAFIYLAWIWARSFGAAQGLLSIGTAASYSFAVLGFYVVSHTLSHRAELRLALKATVWSFAFQLVYVAAQTLSQSALPLPGAKGLSAGGTVDLGGAQTLRPPGTFTHPNALAHYLIVVLAPLFALTLLGPKRLPRHVWALSAALFIGGLAALLATLSRGGWTAFLLAALAIVAIYWHQGLICGRQIGQGLLLAVVGGAMVVIAEPNVLLRLTAPDGRSLESRALLADVAFAIIKANPWVGVGFGDYNRSAFGFSAPSWALVSEDYHFALHQLIVHNHFLLIASELGIPAMLLFIYLLWRFLRLPWPLAQWTEPGRFAVAIGLSAGLLGQTFFLNSDNYYADIRIFLLWMAAGLLQAMTVNQASLRPRRTGAST